MKRLFLAIVAFLTVSCPVLAAKTADPSGPLQAKIITSMGDIVLELESAKAPKTVANFVAYSKGGHYNNTVIYRVVPGFVMQMGSIVASGKGKRVSVKSMRKPIALETDNGLSNKPGTVAMARGDEPRSAQTEFFINLGDNTPLDADPKAPPNTTGFAVFAHVVAGMDVVDAITKVELGAGKGPFPDAMPKKPIRIRRIAIGHFVTVPPPVPETAREASPSSPDDVGAGGTPSSDEFPAQTEAPSTDDAVDETPQR